MRCITAQQSFDVVYNGLSRTFRITDMQFDPKVASDADIGLIETATKVTIDQTALTNKKNPVGDGTLSKAALGAGYSAIGGLSTQIETIRELVELPLMRPELYEHFG